MKKSILLTLVAILGAGVVGGAEKAEKKENAPSDKMKKIVAHPTLKAVTKKGEKLDLKGVTIASKGQPKTRGVSGREVEFMVYPMSIELPVSLNHAEDYTLEVTSGGGTFIYDTQSQDDFVNGRGHLMVGGRFLNFNAPVAKDISQLDKGVRKAFGSLVLNGEELIVKAETQLSLKDKERKELAKASLAEGKGSESVQWEVRAGDDREENRRGREDNRRGELQRRR